MSKTDTIRIRQIERSDLATLAELCQQHAKYERAKWDPDCGRVDRWAGQFFGTSPFAYCWLACDWDNIVGYVSGSLEYSTWQANQYFHMDCLFVRQEYRGRGIGTLLFERVVEFVRSNRIGNLQWQTPAWNKNAAGFYKSLGASVSSKQRFHLETNNQKDY